MEKLIEWLKSLQRDKSWLMSAGDTSDLPREWFVIVPEVNLTERTCDLTKK